MKILEATAWDPSLIGGIGSCLSTLVQGLKQSGDMVDTFYPTQSASAKFVRKAEGVVTRSIHALSDHRWRNAISDMTKAAGIFCREHGRDYDLINCHDAYMGFLPWHEILGRCPPMVLTVHGYLHDEAENILRLSSCESDYLWNLERESYRVADAIIAVDSRLATHVSSLVPSANVHEIANCVDTTEYAQARAYRNSMREELGLCSNTFVVLVARRLVPKNGVRFAVDAMVPLLEQVPNAHLLVAGNGPERDKLKSEVKQLHLAGNVSFLGGIDHGKMVNLYGAADACLVPSIPLNGVVEATSRTVLEAMASGCPVVASDIGGLHELLDDRLLSDLLVQPGEPEGIAAALAKVAEQPSFADRVRMAGSSRVQQKFGLATWLFQYKNVYREIVDKKESAS